MDKLLELGQQYHPDILTKTHAFNDPNKSLMDSFDEALVYTDQSDDQPRFEAEYDELIIDGVDDPEPNFDEEE